MTLSGRFTVHQYCLFGRGIVLLKELNANVNALCTSSTLKSTSSASRAISAVAELLVSHSKFVAKI